MPVTKVTSRWVSGNLQFIKSTDASAIVGGIPAISGSTTSIADALAIPVTHRYVAKTTGADAEALTLADGAPGQMLTLVLAVDGGGAGTLTPSRKTGFLTIVFDDAGDSATLQYADDTLGWLLINAGGLAAAPVVS